MTQNFDTNSTNVTEVRTNKRTNEQTNIQTDERKDENYIPVGINAGGIITQEVYMQELWFLNSAYPLMLVDICLKFHDGLKVIARTRWRQDFVRDKVQREITQKI